MTFFLILSVCNSVLLGTILHGESPRNVKPLQFRMSICHVDLWGYVLWLYAFYAAGLVEIPVWVQIPVGPVFDRAERLDVLNSCSLLVDLVVAEPKLLQCAGLDTFLVICLLSRFVGLVGMTSANYRVSNIGGLMV